MRKDLQNVEALTFDPISRLLYWVDAGAQKIEVYECVLVLCTCDCTSYCDTVQCLPHDFVRLSRVDQFGALLMVLQGLITDHRKQCWTIPITEWSGLC